MNDLEPKLGPGLIARLITIIAKVAKYSITSWRNKKDLELGLSPNISIQNGGLHWQFV